MRPAVAQIHISSKKEQNLEKIWPSPPEPLDGNFIRRRRGAAKRRGLRKRRSANLAFLPVANCALQKFSLAWRFSGAEILFIPAALAEAPGGTLQDIAEFYK